MQRILVVDDVPLFRELIVSVLEHNGLHVIGQAVDGLDAVEQVGALRADLVLMDISMPRLDGIEATRRIRGLYPDTRIVALSLYEDQDTIDRTREAGACAYVKKNELVERLVDTIRCVGHA